jgi:hypothetical protein
VLGVLADKAKRQSALLAYKKCAAGDIDIDATALAACMARLTDEIAPSHALAIIASKDPEATPGVRFDYVSLPTQLKREQVACSELGLFPGSGPFDDCVYSLKDALIPDKY